MLVFEGHTCSVPLFTDTGSIRSLNSKRTCALVSTPAAPFAGSVSTTLGRIRSEVLLVWKVKLPGLLSAFPATSVTVAVTLTVYVVFAAKDGVGVNVRR